MNGIFNPESPVMSFLSRVADLVWLNVLTLICCIPVVTVGAALTALHYVSLKMVRGEDGYLTKSYFKSFKQNFAQATVLWLLFVLILAVAWVDFHYISLMDDSMAGVLRIGLTAVLFLVLCGGIYWFPLLARFENSIKNTVKNAFLLGILHFPKTICVFVIYVGMTVIYYLFLYRLMPLIFLAGISLPVYMASYLFSGIFRKLEPAEENV